MRVLDLFSGIGGFSLGLERAGMETAAFCEVDPFCRKVLKKHWPDVPCHEDIRKLTGADIGPVDVICGGYPCQPFSTAGKRGGAEDDRHLWPEMFRLVEELRPAWVIGENVTGHVGMGLDDVLSDLESAGYAATPFVIPACAVDAPHRRDRLWIVAHAEYGDAGNIAGNMESIQRAARSTRGEQTTAPYRGRETLAHAHGEFRSAGRNRAQHDEPRHGNSVCGTGREWRPEPDVGRVAHGIPRRVDRLRALGNAVVPQVVEVIGRAMMQQSEALEAA